MRGHTQAAQSNSDQSSRSRTAAAAIDPHVKLRYIWETTNILPKINPDRSWVGYYGIQFICWWIIFISDWRDFACNIICCCPIYAEFWWPFRDTNDRFQFITLGNVLNLKYLLATKLIYNKDMFYRPFYFPAAAVVRLVLVSRRSRLVIPQTIHPSEIITMNATARLIVIVIANVNIDHVTRILGSMLMTSNSQYTVQSIFQTYLSIFTRPSMRIITYFILGDILVKC